MQRWLHAVALQGQALRVFGKKIFLFRFATKSIFFQKTLHCTLFRRVDCIPFFFFCFLFFLW